MKIYLLIAKRFLFPRNDFRSNTINFISFIGLFIGAAAIVLSVSVLNGFQGIFVKIPIKKTEPNKSSTISKINICIGKVSTK